MTDRIAFKVQGATPKDGFLLAPNGRSVLRISNRAQSLLSSATNSAYVPKGKDEQTFFLRLLDLGLAKANLVADEYAPSGNEIFGSEIQVSFVVPHYNDTDGLTKTLWSIFDYSKSTRLPLSIEVIVVDDHSLSDRDFESAVEEFTRGIHALDEKGRVQISTVRLPLNSGPARARNVGAAAARESILVFIDCGVNFDAAIDNLLHLVAKSIAEVAAPRITLDKADKRQNGLLIYQRLQFPLDVGKTSGSVGRGGPSYVPSTLLLVASATFLHHGGFDESFRYGEDVDFVKRVSNSGGRCYYDSDVSATHPPRGSLSSLANQAFNYGTSMAPLHRSTKGEIYQFPRGWTNLALFSTTYGHLLTLAAQSARKLRRQKANQKTNPPQNIAITQRDDNLSALRRSFGSIDLAVKIVIIASTIAFRSNQVGAHNSPIRALLDSRAKSNGSKIDFDEHMPGVRSRKRVAIVRYITLSVLFEYLIHLALSSIELLERESEEAEGSIQRGRDGEQSKHRSYRAPLLRPRQLLKLTSTTTVSIVFDISYSAGVIWGSWREKLLPYHKKRR